MYINESCRTRTFDVSALLRSVQNRHPPDVVHRLALNQKEIRTDIYMQESCRTRTVRIFVPLRSVLTEVHWTSSTPSRAMKDSAGLERFEVSALLRSVQDYFFSFIRDEGVAGAVFLRNKSTYWPLAWLVLNSETHV